MEPTNESEIVANAKREIFELLAKERVAHLTASADMMVEPFADDFTSVARGEISRPTREESRARFVTYLGNRKFFAWDDISPPVVYVSDDASLATALVYKRVHSEFQDEDGALAQVETIFAWQETYVRENGKWRLKMVVSTNTPHNITKADKA